MICGGAPRVADRGTTQGFTTQRGRARLCLSDVEIKLDESANSLCVCIMIIIPCQVLTLAFKMQWWRSWRALTTSLCRARLTGSLPIRICSAAGMVPLWKEAGGEGRKHKESFLRLEMGGRACAMFPQISRSVDCLQVLWTYGTSKGDGNQTSGTPHCQHRG